MKTRNLILFASMIIMATSCGSTTQLIIPQAVNTVNAVRLDELNLERTDYQILNTVTAEAIVTYNYSNNGTCVINCPDEDFQITLLPLKTGGYTCVFDGVAKLGYLSNDYQQSNTILSNPEEIARRLAIYKLINQVHLHGADGVIEPIISTNIDNANTKKRASKRNFVFKTTISAKLIKIKSDK